MDRKLADDFAAPNPEFEKLKSGRQWTIDELRSAAVGLEIQNAAQLDRDALIERLIASESRRT